LQQVNDNIAESGVKKPKNQINNFEGQNKVRNK
jgi:hypothetical protein